MKRERYFRDELWRMFAIYAILPAVLFTFFCGDSFYGSSASWERTGQPGLSGLCDWTGKTDSGKL